MPDSTGTVILLVEDQAIIAMAEAELLRGHGYEVITAHSGENALRVVSERTHVNLVLMDINLGSGMNGTETAEKILALADLPVVFLTAYSDRKTVQRVRDITRYGYVVKNSGDFVLLSSIEMALDLFAAHRRAALGERRLHRAQELAQLGSYERDMKTGETWWSAEVYELVGRPDEPPSRAALLDAVHPDDLPRIDEAVLLARESGSLFSLEYRIVQPEGEVRWIRDRAEYWRDQDGTPVRVFGTLQDITDLKRVQLSLQARDEERALLLREVHHRVKNNMETIEALLALQASIVSDPAARESLEEARSRLRTMMVLYDRLYRNDATGEIRIDEFLHTLLTDIESTYARRSGARVHAVMGPRVVPVQTAILLGMIANEAVTNAMKYGTDDGGNIRVSLDGDGDPLVLVVHDDGPGIPDSILSRRADYFGLNLIYLLAGQLGAEIEIDTRDGTTIAVRLE